jgi:hypothetical protein
MNRARGVQSTTRTLAQVDNKSKAAGLGAGKPAATDAQGVYYQPLPGPSVQQELSRITALVQRTWVEERVMEGTGSQRDQVPTPSESTCRVQQLGRLQEALRDDGGAYPANHPLRLLRRLLRTERLAGGAPQESGSQLHRRHGGHGLVQAEGDRAYSRGIPGDARALPQDRRGDSDALYVDNQGVSKVLKEGEQGAEPARQRFEGVRSNSALRSYTFFPPFSPPFAGPAAIRLLTVRCHGRFSYYLGFSLV